MHKFVTFALISAIYCWNIAYAGNCTSTANTYECFPACGAAACPEFAACEGGRCQCRSGYKPYCDCVEIEGSCRCTPKCVQTSDTSSSVSTTGRDESTTGKDETSTTGSATTGNGDTGCGTAWPDGCPDDMFCTVASSNLDERTCVCRKEYHFYNPNLKRCVPRCADFDPFSYYDPSSNQCKCKDGYTADTSSSFLPFVRCKPANTNPGDTCETIRCDYGYTCKMTEQGPTCVPNPTVPKCGVDFKCPDNIRYVCIDTSDGPRCRCAPGYSGLYCQYLACNLDNAGSASCPTNSECVYDEVSPAPFCRCKEGWSGIKCDIPNDKCETITCTGENVVCKAGRCVCEDGFIPTCNYDPRNPNIFACDCKRVDPDACSEDPCRGNYQCVDEEGEAKCVCPYEQYGGSECNKPRCTDDSECREDYDDSQVYCVTNTRTEVPPYCQCKYGLTGPYCNQTSECKSSDCGSNQVCSNEGRCVCRTGYSGEKCEDKEDDSNCKRYELFLNTARDGTALTAEEVQLVLAALIKIDYSDLTVTGPTDTSDPNVKKYIVVFCSDEDVDATKNEAALAEFVSNGQTGLDVVAAPDDSSSSGARMCASVGATIVLSALATQL